ncbi:hypothetical protein PACTADRAFT_50345 [Pachysolen tannophilus NRRL Y-2460]|uniref:RING-type domain-containing protein n=1 Tax=Pachysolen tannophilus NRRL Y-2460 TaxID=669874 RepID=A0A1E4TV90_PACTA|nr:hypothetical protein PACTADRAFT_50345 [Pachysolen tannophilus NRRL Y-2460]
MDNQGSFSNSNLSSPSSTSMSNNGNSIINNTKVSTTQSFASSKKDQLNPSNSVGSNGSNTGSGNFSGNFSGGFSGSGSGSGSSGGSLSFNQSLKNKGKNSSKMSTAKASRKREANSSSKRGNKLSRDEVFDLNLDDHVISNGGSSKGKGRKGQISINHLMQFSYSDDHSTEHNIDGIHKRRPNNKNFKRKNSSNIHLTGKHYINVNYKFVVDHRGDFRPQLLDPNLPIDNNNILRVIIPKNDTQCPICLSENIIAPRMVSCGHCFCLSCLLRYLDSEDPIPPKSNEINAKQKKKECPLCANRIKKDEILPVLINPIDERFEIPKSGEDVILQLMYRPINKILTLPYQLKLRNKNLYGGNIPWFNSNSSNTMNNHNNNDLELTDVSDLFQYSRIMKAGLNFIIENYEREIIDIKRQYEEDKALFDDDGIYAQKAIKQIEGLIEDSKISFLNDSIDSVSLGSNGTTFNSTSDELGKSDYEQQKTLEDLSIIQSEQHEFDDSNTYFFYETSFNSKIKFFTSQLDNKILKTLYGQYSLLPICLKMRIENILYDYIVDEELIKKFKFLSYLPLGTEIAFLELDWFERDNGGKTEFKRTKNERKLALPLEISKIFGKELISRSNKTRSKNFKEESLKKKYEKELEIKTRNFFANENNNDLHYYTSISDGSSYNNYNSYNSLMADDHYNEEVDYDVFLPPLTSSEADQDKHDKQDIHQDEVDNEHEQEYERDKEQNTTYETTVWGTKIAKIKDDTQDLQKDNHDDGMDLYFEELLRQSKEKKELKNNKKKGKKKLVLLSSNGRSA